MKNLRPYFSQNPLDRLDLIRDNESEVKGLKKAINGIYLMLDGDNIIIDKKSKGCFFSRASINSHNIHDDEIVLLGRYENIDYFALTNKNELSKNLVKLSIREFTNTLLLCEDKLGIIAQAAAVLHWHDSHKYCSSCGAKTIMSRAGWKRNCLSCEAEHFPRVDTVVIMLVTYNDYCLIGRGVNFAHDRYSCLAGYVESGETFEDASRRELYEEAGVIGLESKYILSQPWPFPFSLMVGMHVQAQAQELKLDYNELSDAKWVHKRDIKAILEGDVSFDFSFPDKIAIARNLLELWVDDNI